MSWAVEAEGRRGKRRTQPRKVRRLGFYCGKGRSLDLGFRQRGKEGRRSNARGLLATRIRSSRTEKEGGNLLLSWQRERPTTIGPTWAFQRKGQGRDVWREGKKGKRNRSSLIVQRPSPRSSRVIGGGEEGGDLSFSTKNLPARR